MKRTPLTRKTPLRAKSPLKARKPMKRTRTKTTPERQRARGCACLVKAAGVCNGDWSTTVLAHFRFLGECGMASKPDDLQGAHACSACNAWTDSPTPRQVEDVGGRIAYERDRNFYAARALARMRQIDRSRVALEGAIARLKLTSRCLPE